MPLPTTFAGVSSRGEGGFLGSYGPPPIGGPYFMNVEVPVPDQAAYLGVQDQVFASCVDSSGNIYTTSVGYVGTSCVTVSKYNSSGVVQWATGFNVTNGVSSNGMASPLPPYMAVDSSGTVYAQYYFQPQGAYIACYIAKFNGSTGSVITCLTAGTSTLVYVDLSGNMYFSDTVANGNGGSNAVLSKYNSSNSCVWKSVYYSSYGQTASTSQIKSCVVDSSQNVYLSMQGTGPTTSNVLSYIAKLDSSGQSVWEAKVGTNTYGIALDNSGNIFVVSNYLPPGGVSVNGYTSKGQIISFTNSGAFRWGWQGQTSTWFDACTLYAVATDSSGNVFVGGNAVSANGASNGGVIAKFNNSGTLLTSGSLYGSSSSSTNDPLSNCIRSINVDRSDNTYWTGAVQSNKATYSGSKTAYNVAEGILIKDTNSIMSTHGGSFTVNSNVTANWTTGITNNNMSFGSTGTLNSGVSGTSYASVTNPYANLTTASAIFGNALTNTNGGYSTGPGISNYKVTI